MNQEQKYLDLAHKLFTSAKIADTKAKKLKARLSSFPLWKRLVFYRRFNKLRAKIKEYQDARFYCVSMALSCTRKAARARRVLNKPKRLGK